MASRMSDACAADDVSLLKYALIVIIMNKEMIISPFYEIDKNQNTYD